MTIPEFFQHLGKNLEEFLFGHVVGQSVMVSTINFVPIQSVFLVLVVEETILGVYGVPEGFEIALGGIVGYVLGDAGSDAECEDKKYAYLVIQNGTKCSEESRKHKVDDTEIFRFALNDR